MESIKHKVKIADILILVLIALVIYFIFSSKQKKNVIPQQPVLISSSIPANNSSGASVFDPISITFNQPIDASTINITSDPAENWTISQIRQNSIDVNHKLYLRVSTNYTLNISQHGSIIGTIVFETSHEQNDPRELQGLQADLDKNYPLISLTPHITSDYQVVYIAPLTLEIDLKSSISAQDAISQIKSWVQSNGVDPATHKYNVVAAPINSSPTPGL